MWESLLFTWTTSNCCKRIPTKLINLVLDARLEKKHQCLAQGLAFLYNNMKLCGNSQEAMYNIAREFVLTTREKDFSMPRFPYNYIDQTVNQMSGYCNVKSAYYLHLIYRDSGAFDLARQVLKEHFIL